MDMDRELIVEMLDSLTQVMEVNIYETESGQIYVQAYENHENNLKVFTRGNREV